MVRPSSLHPNHLSLPRSSSKHHPDCIRADLSTRFASLNLQTTHLPSGPPSPHIPILHSAHLPAAKRLILYFGESFQDLGVFAYRTIGQISNAAGSCIDFVSAIHAVPEGAEAPAVLIANCGQLIWYRRGGRAVTQQTWSALPRKTGVSLPYQLDPEKNRVKGHKTIGEHVESVFEWVSKEANDEVRIDVVSVGDSVEEVVRYLETHWGTLKAKVEAVAIGRLVFSAIYFPFFFTSLDMKIADMDIMNSGHAWLGEHPSIWGAEFAYFWSRVRHPPLLISSPHHQSLQTQPI